MDAIIPEHWGTIVNIKSFPSYSWAWETMNENISKRFYLMPKAATTNKDTQKEMESRGSGLWILKKKKKTTKKAFSRG